MNRVKIVALETFKNHMRSTSFWIMILFPIIFGIIGGLVGGNAGSSDSSSTPLGIVVDDELATYFETDDYKIVNESEIDNLKEADEIFAFAKVSNDNGQIRAEMSDMDLDPTRMMGFNSNLDQIQNKINQEEAGLDPSQADILSRRPIIDEISDGADESIEPEDDSKGGSFIGMGVYLVLLMLMYIVLISFTNIVLTEVATEKGTKMIEFIFSSVKPGDYFAGKMLGNFLAVFVQILIYLLVIVVGVFFAKAKGLFDGLDLNLTFDASVIPMILVIALLFLLGIFLYLIIAGMLGSFAEKAEDAGKIGMPLIFPTIIFFLLAMNMVTKGDLVLAKVLSFIPISSTFFMPLRLLNGYASTGQGLISVAILVITILLAYKFGEKIYKKNILNYSSGGWFKKKK